MASINDDFFCPDDFSFPQVFPFNCLGDGEGSPPNPSCRLAILEVLRADDEIDAIEAKDLHQTS
jgi:hypothetical protein